MKIKNQISSAIIAAATGMLQPFISDLTPFRLIAALEAYDGDDTREMTMRPLAMYTIKEACEQLQISRPSVYRLFESGKLSKIKVGGLTRIPANEVNKILQGG